MTSRPRHLVIITVAATALIAGVIMLYRANPIAGLTAAVGSTTIVFIVLAHVGVLAATFASLAAWRRRRRHRSQ